MIAFELSVNGEKLCTAGVGDKGILNAIIGGPNPLHLRVGGLSKEKHLQWITPRPKTFELKAGDEITIRIVETDVVDEPASYSVSPTRAEREDGIKEHLEKARALLPKSVDLESYHERLSQDHFMGAMDVLEKLGEESGASAEFWEELINAAHAQTAYEDRNRYMKKRRAMEDEAQTEQE